MKGLKNFSSSASFQALVVLVIVSANLIWFLPTVGSLRQNISEAEKLKIEKSLASMGTFFGNMETSVETPSRYLTLPLQSPENERVIRKILKGNYFVNISLIDARGDEILKFSKNEFISAKDFGNVSQKGDFKEVLQTNKSSWSAVRISDTFEPFIAVNVPVFGGAGEVVGVLKAEFSVRSLFEGLSVQSYDSGKIYVVDKGGLLISHPDNSLVLKNTNLSDRRVVKDAVREKAVVVADDDTYRYTNEDGIEVLSAGGYFDRPSLIVVYEENRSDALSSIRRIETSFVVAFLFISFMVWVLRRITAKVERARKELESSLAEQKKLLEAVEKSRGELGVANEGLGRQKKEIEEKVAELEKFQRLVVGRELKMVELKKEIEDLKGKIPKGG